MRTEQDMMNLILSTAREDERIRAVILGGSRTNPDAPKDQFQDYDIIYIVRDIDSFTADHSWVDRFGPRIMMQMPEAKVLPPADNTGHFIYLMQFQDGNRIDLTLMPEGRLLQLDSLNVLLLDKDGSIPPLQAPSNRDYLVKPPSAQQFADICNEFWWICLNISKGLWRRELPYAMFMYEQINRNVLLTMLNWSVGVRTDFTVSTGKAGKYLERYLTPEEWREFTATYTDADYEHIWQALFGMCDLFRKQAVFVAEHFGFAYPHEDDARVMAYMKRTP
ncbi:aminoglycoside 6-adenylyltransferase [Ectobacillus ponti]|uniref:Aminoglycoside 6-adenylyltransferase n=1 Tax=Ectobacillus ponti TaxID=2961894 RepID=A0AA42BNX5_9BACI|nr:aminoglycoside 6-adenylyltransferase [Ectobacillus ponti]MCP8967811.1 aminoglycoside 6-adenylyltransferase [Ectobacillus ponti]